MSIPSVSREYRLPKVRSQKHDMSQAWLNRYILQYEGFNSLTLTEAEIPKLKSHEVLLKVHAVSLQSRDLAVAKNQYPLGYVL